MTYDNAVNLEETRHRDGTQDKPVRKTARKRGQKLETTALTVQGESR